MVPGKNSICDRAEVTVQFTNHHGTTLKRYPHLERKHLSHITRSGGGLLQIKVGKLNGQLPSTAPLRSSVNLTHFVVFVFFFWGFKRYIDPTESRPTPTARVGYR